MSSTPSQNRRRLTYALAITLTFMVCELIAGVFSGSLALLADAGHMLTDAGALVLSLMVIWLSAKPATARKTFGYRRTEILVAPANGLMLWVTVGIIAHEAYHRLKNPPDVLAKPMFIVACLGLAANLVTAMILKGGHDRGHSHNVSLNMRRLFARHHGYVGLRRRDRRDHRRKKPATRSPTRLCRCRFAD